MSCLCVRVGMCPVSVGFHLVISRGQLIVSDASRQDHDDNKVIHATLFVVAPSPKKMTKEQSNHDGDKTRHNESKNQEKFKRSEIKDRLAKDKGNNNNNKTRTTSWSFANRNLKHIKYSGVGGDVTDLANLLNTTSRCAAVVGVE